MKIPIPNFLRWYPVLSLMLASILLGISTFMYNYLKTETHIPVTLSGIQHLGGDYRIDHFYINKDIGDTVGESGGGGGIVCCLMLPKKWTAGLKADVRWEVRHIIRSSDPSTPETEEVVGLYRAQVPVEAYVEPDRFWVHFFPQGRIRIVVSPVGPNSEHAPIRMDDPHAVQKATAGSVVKALFTAEEIAESEHEAARDKKKYGDWR